MGKRMRNEMKEVPFSSPPSCLREIERWHTHSLAINLRNEETRVKDLSLERRDEVNDRQVLTPHLVSFPFSYLLSLRDSRAVGERGHDEARKRAGEKLAFIFYLHLFPLFSLFHLLLHPFYFRELTNEGGNGMEGNDGCMTSLLLVSYPHLLVLKLVLGED